MKIAVRTLTRGELYELLADVHRELAAREGRAVTITPTGALLDVACLCVSHPDFCVLHAALQLEGRL